MGEPLRASSDANTAPDWSVVPFAVACARCGHDLHGRSEPTCPGCALTFRWADAVPIEQLSCASCGYHLYGLKEPRCPECATEFTWDEALASYHRQRKPLFEYQWRKRPVRSLFHTWLLALRPKKLWTLVDIHDPVHWKPLMVSALIALTGMMLLIFAATLLLLFHYALLRALSVADRWRALGYSLIEVMMEDLDWVMIGLRSPNSVILTSFMAIWFTCLALSLLIFQQSMQRSKVRAVHIVRIVSYACAIGWPGLLLSMIIPVVICRFWEYCDHINSISVILIAMVWIYSLRSVALAYRDYLRMDHPWAASAAAHLVAFLLTLVLAIPLLPDGAGVSVLEQIGETIGLF